MAYRNGTYIAFHAQGTSDPFETDMKYYNLLKAWDEHNDHPFYFTNSHDKTESVRDSSKRETLRSALVTRLRNSKNMVLIIGQTTRFDTDWIPFEISYAIDECEIPIIAAYPGLDFIVAPSLLSNLWPAALASRIQNGTAHVIHVPFRKEPLVDAVPRFSHENYPNGGGLGIYNNEAYRQWGLMQ